MGALEHSLLATGLLAAFYYYGRWQGRNTVVNDAIERTLDTLEEGGFIKVEVNHETKEKTLIPLDKSV